MIQYEIKKVSSFRFIKDLYKRFLKSDRYWHFFYEGDYMLLRLGRRSNKIESYFDNKNILYSVIVWKDANVVVRKRQKIFKELFHCYSVLSMEVGKKEFMKNLDRIIHCYCNMSWGTLKKLKLAETDAVAQYVVHRARYEGMMRKK